MQDSYTYAVARIRALEVSLFSNSTIEQLISMPDFDSCQLVTLMNMVIKQCCQQIIS